VAEPEAGAGRTQGRLTGLSMGSKDSPVLSACRRCRNHRITEL